MEPRFQRKCAFTLIEVLVVITTIVLLAAMLLPACSRTKVKAQQACCLNNVKQLNLGVQIYMNSFADTYPGASGNVQAAANGGMNLDSDWIYFKDVWPNALNRSPILIAIGASANTNVFRCPRDRDRPGVGRGNGYPASYSMTNFDPPQNGAHNIHGITSTFAVPGPGVVQDPFKQSAVRDPASKILIAEEPAYLTPDDAPMADINGAQTVIDDGRWVPLSGTAGYTTAKNYLTVRHDGKADVGFCDDHAEVVPWTMGTNQAHTFADY